MTKFRKFKSKTSNSTSKFAGFSQSIKCRLKKLNLRPLIVSRTKPIPKKLPKVLSVPNKDQKIKMIIVIYKNIHKINHSPKIRNRWKKIFQRKFSLLTINKNKKLYKSHSKIKRGKKPYILNSKGIMIHKINQNIFHNLLK